MAHVLKWEGHYVDDDDDPGGETKYGISKRAHPDVDIANLTEDDAKEIYRREYWVPAGCPRITHEGLACFHMDTAVNLGVARAVKLLQQAAFITPNDGRFGQVTESHLKLLHRWGQTSYVLQDYYKLRVHHYTRLAHSDPSRRKFLLGWLRRTLDALGMET